MTNHFPLSPFGTTIMGADQLGLLMQMTFTVSSFSISSLTHLQFSIATGYGFWDAGLESPVSMVISVNSVVPMAVSSFANYVSYSFSSVLIWIGCLALAYDEGGQTCLIVPVQPSSS